MRRSGTASRKAIEITYQLPGLAGRKTCQLYEMPISETNVATMQIEDGDLIFIPEAEGFICGIAEVNESGYFCIWEDAHRPVQTENFLIIRQKQVIQSAGHLVGKYFPSVKDISDHVRPFRV